MLAFACRKNKKSFVFFASLCVIICLPEEGVLLCLLSTVDPSAEQRQVPSMGPAHRKECKRMSPTFPLSCLWQLKVGIFLVTPLATFSPALLAPPFVLL